MHFDVVDRWSGRCVIAYIVLAVGLAAFFFVFVLFTRPIYAQPELKVGQEVEVFYTADGKDYECKGEYRGTGESLVAGESHEVFYIHYGIRGIAICTPSVDEITGYRILKPAPRPEFSWTYLTPYADRREQDCHSYACFRNLSQEAFKDIYKELRYLRKEIKKHHE